MANVYNAAGLNVGDEEAVPGHQDQDEITKEEEEASRQGILERIIQLFFELQ